MYHSHISPTLIRSYETELHEQEKSPVTIGKYLRDIRRFADFCGKEPLSKEIVLSFKSSLMEEGYAAASINSMLAAVNHLLSFAGRSDCRVRMLRMQKKIYTPENKELTKQEYLRLLQSAEKKYQLKLVLQTICSTGIRVSELKYFTVEGIRAGEITVRCKSKTRLVLIPAKLKKILLRYACQSHISSGCIFITRNGNPLDRSNLWTQMKSLCAAAKVEPDKVFPHNLRKLFARTFYEADKDIAKLADILGHSSINTTRIYIMSTGTEHRKRLDQMGLLL